MLEYTPVPEEQIRQFDEQGYLIVRDVLNKETIATLTKASDLLIDSDLQGLGKTAEIARHTFFS